MEKAILAMSEKTKKDLAEALSKKEVDLKLCQIEHHKLSTFLNKMSQASVNQYPETTRLLKYMKKNIVNYQNDIAKTLLDACLEHGIVE